ncbi:hypothetical protein CDAR_296041 [Caerostris darwini]|uniref:Uncharacterized protein n=1 Tax=Caerostris darwini TaxID=1538125 RepID=A0AAV4SUW1_9ARAC|nr:hypothetical protein CDAR_296041 [Caerostris darwini]
MRLTEELPFLEVPVQWGGRMSSSGFQYGRDYQLSEIQSMDSPMVNYLIEKRILSPRRQASRAQNKWKTEKVISQQ